MSEPLSTNVAVIHTSFRGTLVMDGKPTLEQLQMICQSLNTLISDGHPLVVENARWVESHE